jgi:hypothetical protein
MMAKGNPSEKPDFYRHHTLDELAAMQGVGPMDDEKWAEMKAIAAELWPNDEGIEAFHSFLREIRGHGSVPI